MSNFNATGVLEMRLLDGGTQEDEWLERKASISNRARCFPALGGRPTVGNPHLTHKMPA